jgi:hypothetical protein
MSTETSDSLDGVMRRVRKLLAIAEDGRANAEEAASAAGMAERIMRKYQIEHADVISAELARGGAAFDDTYAGTTLDPEGWSKEASGWSGILGVAVAMFHDCQCRYTRTEKHGKSLRFSGYAADAQMARFSYVYLVQSMTAAGRQFAKLGYGRRETEAFRRGFNSAVCKTLRKATAAKKASMQELSSARALVVVKAGAVSQHFGDIRYSRATTTRGEGFAEGFERGSKVDVTRRGVGGPAAHLQIG